MLLKYMGGLQGLQQASVEKLQSAGYLTVWQKRSSTR
jgi:hypothetical protein